MPKRFERLEAVVERTGRCVSTIYADMKAGTFPPNFPISRQARAWDAEEIDGYLRVLADARAETSDWNIIEIRLRDYVKQLGHPPYNGDPLIRARRADKKRQAEVA